jgi:uncharacterized protein YecE (DUF72 family)
MATLVDSVETARSSGQECWCIFDNTAAGAAIFNALAVVNALHEPVTD